jgi:hypothetical protein
LLDFDCDHLHSVAMVGGEQKEFILKVPRGTKLTGSIAGTCIFWATDPK